MTLSERIAMFLKIAIKDEKKYTQVEFAKLMDVAPASVNKWLSGGAPAIDKLPMLCSLLEISPNVLFDYQKSEEDKSTEELLSKLKQYPSYRSIIEKLLSQIIKDMS